MRLPLGSPELPWQLMRGRVIGMGTRGCTGCMWGLARMGVRMGMADMDERPTERFGIEPIPVRRKHTREHGEIKNIVLEDIISLGLVKEYIEDVRMG